MSLQHISIIRFISCYVLCFNFLSNMLRNLYISKVETYMSFKYPKGDIFFIIRKNNNSSFLSCFLKLAFVMLHKNDASLLLVTAQFLTIVYCFFDIVMTCMEYDV